MGPNKNVSKIIKMGMEQKKLGTNKTQLPPGSMENQTVLLRDFIHDRLYQQPGGYFSKTEH